MRPVTLKSTLLPLLVVATILAATTANAAQADYAGLARAIQDTKDATGHQTGTAVIVLKDGRIAYEGYFGFADIAAKTPVDRDTVFYIASATKPFFALNALLAEHAGKLDTSTSLQAMFPEARFTGVDASQPTLRQLLTHTSGVENVPLGWATAFSGVHDEASRQRLVLASHANAVAPLGTFDYTNIGYNIASTWLDRIDPMPWQEQLQSRIFKPLGMTRTTTRTSDAEARGWVVAKPYTLASGERDVPVYLRKTDATMHAAGGMLSTARDLAKFLAAQLADGRIEGQQAVPGEVIRASQQRQATTDSRYLDFPRDGYAWGWYTGEYKGQRMLHHFGGFAGFHAHLSFMPEAGIGLIVLNNEDMLGARLTNLVADHAYGVALGEADVANRSAPRFAQLAQDAQQLQQGVARQRAALLARPWRLSLARADYAGRYVHPDLGAIVVTHQADDGLALRWGQLQAVATGFDEADRIRVEFVPSSGNVLAFIVADRKVAALTFDGMRFERQR